MSRLQLQHDVEQFLYRQAELLDAKRWQDWIDLFTPDGVYWMPADPSHKHWDGMPAIFAEDAAEWRVHFHVPIFVDRYATFRSTQDELRRVLALVRELLFTDTATPVTDPPAVTLSLCAALTFTQGAPCWAFLPAACSPRRNSKSCEEGSSKP